MPTFEETVAGIEGLSEENAKALTEGYTGAIKLAGEKSEADITALRATKDGELETVNRTLALLKAEPGKAPTTELGQDRAVLQAKFSAEDAAKAQTSAVADGIAGAQAMWQAKADAAAAGVPEGVVAATTTLGELSIATAMYKALKPEGDNKGTNESVPGAGRRGAQSSNTGKDAGEVMLDWVSKNMNPMGNPGK
jgi:hypothetical protein